MTAPVYVTYTMLVSNLAIIAALIFGLHQALKRAGWAAEARASVVRTTSLILIAWYGTAYTLSWFEFFRGLADRIPTIEFGIFLPIIAGSIALWRSSILSRILDAIPQPWLVAVQVYRTIGLIFLILWGSGRLPGEFALLAGAGDVFVGVTAPLVALIYARGKEIGERLVGAWNAFGILDLIVAVGTGFLTTPPFQLLSPDAPNELISAFPLVIVPVFAVPLSILLHVMSLMKLRRTRMEKRASHSSLAATAF
jgi:hypothetical protein